MFRFFVNVSLTLEPGEKKSQMTPNEFDKIDSLLEQLRLEGTAQDKFRSSN